MIPRWGEVALVEPDAVGAEIDAAVARVRAAGFTVEATVGDLDGLDAIRRLTLLRLVQESLTNVMKHANHAVPVRFTIDRNDHGITLTVVSGADNAATTPGHGIVGMRERTELAGGTLTAAAEDQRWVVRAHLPDRPRGGHE
ncbi:sensor histidine kinase [Nocardia coubleae]|uniref:sensor histidine kinase n=1 Tax=Nocardia coubleae TaxID=356147 RepID=UPI0028995E93|nr:hypothetical protein [Nocardia coubleae]